MRIRGIAIIAAMIILFSSFSVVAQPGPRTGSGGGTAPTAKPKAPAEPTQKTRAPITIIQYRDRPVSPTTGRLFVSAEPGAKILLEPLNVKNARSQKGTVPAGKRGFVFSDLKPGNYRVAATLAEFHEEEKTPVTIKKNESQDITLFFRRILYTVTINSNVDGELKYNKEGEIQNVLPLQNKSIMIRLPAGDYVAEINPAEPVYETRDQKFSVKQDNTVVDLQLKRIVDSTGTLAPTWTNAELKGWEMPSAWQPDSQRNLSVKGRGVALPRDARNRYYKDFRLESNVKMTNGVAISFALRARDSKNYYLLQITSENSDESNFVRLFIVKNGEEQRLQVIPISRSKAAAMASGQFFIVSIKMIGYEITVDIVDSQTGAPYNLGVLTDPDHNFAIGAVGIAARDNEENVIGRFIVCTGKCLR